MNKRIQEIVDDATLYADGYFDRDCAAWSKIYNEKLAELIIQTCMLQCHHNDDMDRIEKYFEVKQ